MVNVANIITVSRVVLALLTLALLPMAGNPSAANTAGFSSENILWTAFGLTVLVIWADGLDGFFARKLNQCTKFGAILDIAGDRCVEMAYWIVFCALGWVPLFVPLLYLVRGTFVDAMRSHASEQGLTAFGAKTMMQSPLGKFLVASNFSRFTYAVVKALAFCLVIAAHTAALDKTALPTVALYLVYFSCFFCVARGLPVLIEGQSLFKV
ncbi:MAG: CDP-alcohol phosphatidyltransferase family protein [Cyanobacteria bacterium REEB67]|nr:CDP-alcohol phosphatidyltransferase family protein [Cyanobacteria bacterium REEB67]